MRCKSLPDIGLGHNHMDHIVEFADNVRWVARLCLPGLSEVGEEDDPNLAGSDMGNEYSTIRLVLKESRISVPRIYSLEGNHNSRVNAPFMLMDCLEGNVGMDLSMGVPAEYKTPLFTSMAEVHVCHKAFR